MYLAFQMLLLASAGLKKNMNVDQVCLKRIELKVNMFKCSCNMSQVSPRQAIVLPPDADKLVQVMGTEDWRVSCQVLKVIHNHCHKQIQHLQREHQEKFWGGKQQKESCRMNNAVFCLSTDQERTEEDEWDEIAVSKVRPAASLVVRRQGEGRDGGVRFTLLTWQTGEHDLLPGLSRRTPGGSSTKRNLVYTKLKSTFSSVNVFFDTAHLNSSISALKNVLKLLCWLMWLSSFSLMFPNTCRKQVASVK